MAISTSTLPRFISFSMSRVTSLGAAAPGISTAPITRCARAMAAAMAALLEKAVFTRPSNISSISARRAVEMS